MSTKSTKSATKPAAAKKAAAPRKSRAKKVAAAPVEEVVQEAPQLAAPAAAATVEAVAPATEGKRTIEKDREERNGVKRPSAGGLCRAVWDFCDSVHTAEHTPAVKEVRLEAEARGWNPNNASIEYYQWRKFMGIRGRLAKQVASDNAPDATLDA